MLDFGLAKMGGTPTVQGDESPTLTIAQTEAGVILGTASYMSPEQARGKPVDQRADIYAFGAVLHEMLSGKRLHRGETTTEVLASVIKEEPRWGEIPVQVQHLLRRCLEKDPQKRLRHIGDVMELVDRTPKPASTPITHRNWAWAAAALTVLIVGAAVAWFLKRTPEQPMLQMEISPPEGAKFVNAAAQFALSPDGRRIVFIGANKDGKRMLWVRPIDSSSAVALEGTENAADPFWSPDSRWVGFGANGKLQKIDVPGGGQPQVICDAEGFGGTWSTEGVIVFHEAGKALQRVSAAGGTPVPLLALDANRQEIGHQTPFFLPDGRHLLYSSYKRTGADSMLASLDGKMNRVLLPAVGVVTYAPDPRGGGWVLYSARGQLMARRLDAVKGEFTGPPAVLADGVTGPRWWSASWNGLLAFRHNYGMQYQLTWFNRDGRMLGNVGDPGLLSTPRISPDQKTIAFQRTSDQNPDIWTFDLARNASARFTFEPGPDGFPIWSSDGRNIIYSSSRNSARFVVQHPASGVGKEEMIVTGLRGGNALVPTAVTHDGRWLVLTEATLNSGVIVLQSREDPNKIVRIQERGRERDGSISPDGRWLLYSSVPAARREVLVQSVPKEAGGSASAVGKWQISTAGGSHPTWRGDGKEIFYVAPDGMMMAVPVESGEDFFRPGAHKPLFQTHLDIDAATTGAIREYDVTPDGQRFLVNQHVADSADAPITMVVNWPKLLVK